MTPLNDMYEKHDLNKNLSETCAKGEMDLLGVMCDLGIKDVLIGHFP